MDITLGSTVSVLSAVQYWCWHEVSSEERPGLMELRLRGLRPPRKFSFLRKPHRAGDAESFFDVRAKIKMLGNIFFST